MDTSRVRDAHQQRHQGVKSSHFDAMHRHRSGGFRGKDHGVAILHRERHHAIGKHKVAAPSALQANSLPFDPAVEREAARLAFEIRSRRASPPRRTIRGCRRSSASSNTARPTPGKTCRSCRRNCRSPQSWRSVPSARPRTAAPRHTPRSSRPATPRRRGRRRSTGGVS